MVRLAMFKIVGIDDGNRVLFRRIGDANVVIGVDDHLVGGVDGEALMMKTRISNLEWQAAQTRLHGARKRRKWIGRMKRARARNRAGCGREGRREEG